MEEVHVRQAGAADAAAISVVHRSAFAGDAEAELVEALAGSSHYVPELSLVAEIGGRVCGHIMLFRVALQKPDGVSVDVLALAPMAVVPSRTHRGVGSALIRAALTRAASLAYRAVIVVGYPDYYGRFGFSEARDKGVSCPLPVPAESVLACELVTGALEGGGQLLYPQEFTRLFRQPRRAAPFL